MTVRTVSRPSPNHGARPRGTAIDLIVLHADAGTSDEGTLSWITNRESEVSYHVLIGRDGTVYRCVPDGRRAWHAGRSAFDGRPDCNDYALGIAFANNQKGEAFTPDQLLAGAYVVGDWCRKYRIPLTRITTHAHISPGRKFDPGPLFPIHQFLGSVEAAIEVAK